MTPLIVALVGVFAVLLVIWNVAKMRSFQRDFGFDGEFPGKPYECDLRTTNSEMPIQCRIGATDSALYLMANPHAQPTRTWRRFGKYGSFRALYKTGLRIPWTDVQCRAGKMFFKDVMWFENRSRRFYVYIPRVIGEKVLTDAGREIPVRN